MATISGEYVIPTGAREGQGGPQAPVVVQVFAQTDVGRTREHNEDSFIVVNLSEGEPLQFERLVEQPADPAATLFMVADGMGGAAAGEVASATAVDVVLRHLREKFKDLNSIAPPELAAELSRAAEKANWSIFQQAVNKPELRGMGTTATIAVLLSDTLYVAQVGDSRAYLIRNSVATQLTKDQSLMQKLIEAGELTEEEALLSERRNIILQALGPEANVKVDVTVQPLRRGDVLLLCSDGLSGLVRPDDMARIVDEELDLSVACDRLIAMANDQGGPDNITVVAARFEGHGLNIVRSADEVGYREFSAAPTPAEGTVPPPAPERDPDAVTQAWPTTSTVDDERRRRGRLYSRLILAIGAGILAFLAWRFFA
jgi:serine/threonine protein phosphatase PrpC